MQKKIVVILAAAMLMALPAVGSAATIRSADIYAADGTSGQTLTTGNGIKTGHIQNSAVTGAKIANGAVTDAKISGTISAAKLDLSSVQRKYAQVVVVAQSGGDFTSPIAAVNSITDASAAKPYLIKVMPGVYDLGSASLQMKQFVDLEGSGLGNTTIKSSVTNYGDCMVGTVNMANNSSLRNIKVENQPPADGDEAAAVAITNVKATVEGVSVVTGNDSVSGPFRNNGVCVYGQTSDGLLNNVNIETHNVGGQSNPIIMFWGGNATVKNAAMTAYNSPTAGNFHCVNSDGGQGGVMGSVKVYNSTCDGTGPQFGDAIFTLGYTAEIMDSVFRMRTGTVIYSGDEGVTLVNSRFIVTGAPAGYVTGPLIAVSSQLPAVGALPGGTLTNCYDENYRPIPNQP